MAGNLEHPRHLYVCDELLVDILPWHILQFYTSTQMYTSPSPVIELTLSENCLCECFTLFYFYKIPLN